MSCGEHKGWHDRKKCSRCGMVTSNIRKHYWKKHRRTMMKGR